MNVVCVWVWKRYFVNGLSANANTGGQKQQNGETNFVNFIHSRSLWAKTNKIPIKPSTFTFKLSSF